MAKNSKEVVQVAKKLKSIFTDDMEQCYFSGSNDVERHH